MSAQTAQTTGIARKVPTMESKTSSSMQNEEVIRKCRQLLTIPGSQPGRPVSPVRQLINHFDGKFLGFIIGQRQSSLQKNVTMRRIRPTPVGKLQTTVPIKDMESHVVLQDKHHSTKSTIESPAKTTKSAEKVLTREKSKTVGDVESSSGKSKTVDDVESSSGKSKTVGDVESFSGKSKTVDDVESSSKGKIAEVMSTSAKGKAPEVVETFGKAKIVESLHKGMAVGVDETSAETKGFSEL